MKMEFAALACTVLGFLLLGDLGSSPREIAVSALFMVAGGIYASRVRPIEDEEPIP